MESERIIHVVDDDPSVRRSLERLLYSAGFRTVLYENARSFFDAAPGQSAGCVLLDVKMPEIDGLELQARLNRLGFPLPVIVMTGHGDIQTAVRAMKAGAVDFIEKPFDDDSLIAAIETALAGSGRDFRDREIAEAAERIASLSPREREVLDALVAGRQSKVIAYELGLSVRTVEVHRARMLERLGTRRLAEAVRLAVLAGLARDNHGTEPSTGRRAAAVSPCRVSK
jgi:two-component system, LuxR family, response regulator FixJ